MATPPVSVIVVSYNRADDLRLCLSAIRASGYPDLEVIVVDNASTDEAPAVAASFPGTRLVRNDRNAGFAEANNQGLAVARGKYIILLNNDAVVAPDYVSGMVAFLEAHPECAAAGGKAFFWDDVHPVGDRRSPYYSYTLVDPDSGRNPASTDTPDDLQEVATLSGCALVLRRAAIDGLRGGFLDPFFFTYYEETDLCARLLRQGWKLYYTGEPAAWHRVRPRTTDFPYSYHFHMERNRILYAFRNFDSPELERLQRTLARRTRRDLLRAPFRGLARMDTARRAQLDARNWYRANRGFLDTQRRELAGFPHAYNATVREIQAREMYHRHARPEVLALVPVPARRVVDVGCGAGYLGAAIKRLRPETEVRGIEIVAEKARAAGRILDEAVAASAEDPMPAGWPRPDCVIFADVLEHLRDPWEVLRSWAAQLAPGGTIVASLPNVAHASVLRPLAGGRWEYEEAGVLDRTHLRFFTRASIPRLVEAGGLDLLEVKRVLDVPGDLPFRRSLARWARRAAAGEPSAGLRGWRRFLLDACTVQYLVVARRREGTA